MSIVLDHLTKRYERQPVVNNVALEIADGEFFVLLGPSGSGKSTVLRMIAGLAEVDSGQIALHGRNVTKLTPQERGIGFVFQQYALFQHMTVGDNIEFALKIRKVGASERRRRRDQLLELVGLAGLGGRMPRQLSGGQQQRVALARALAHNPTVLLLDEPFGALDAKIRGDLRRTLRAIQRELRVTTVFVTHDQEEAFELADRIGVMNMGRLLEVGPPEELYQRPQTEFVATFLGTANLLMGTCSASGVTVGPMQFALTTQSAGAPAAPHVQVLFRPEDIMLASAEATLQHPTLGYGEVQSHTFVGAFERLRIRIPNLPNVRAIAPVRPFGDAAILVDVTRAPDEARRLPLYAGDHVWVGVRRIHALAHPGLNLLLLSDGSATANPGLELGGQLARLAHARTTLLGYGAASAAHVQQVKEQIGSGLPALETHTSAEALAPALAHAVEQQTYDLAVVGVAPKSSSEVAATVLSAGRHHVLLVPETPPTVRRALICVADGEPGKEDILFAGRLLRHFGAQATIMSVTFREDHTAFQRERIEQFLAAGVRTLQQLDVPAHSMIQAGLIADVIASELNDGDYDLLVLGVPLPGRDGRVAITGVVQQMLSSVTKQAILIVRSHYVANKAMFGAAQAPSIEEFKR